MKKARIPPSRMHIPPGTPPSPCLACKTPLFFVKTGSGKSMPCEADGTPHFANCPAAKAFSGKTRVELAKDGTLDLFGAKK